LAGLEFTEGLVVGYPRDGLVLGGGLRCSRVLAEQGKIWLEPIAALARNDGFNARDLREIVNIATEHRAFFVEK
jgi:hypothetical protein